MRLIRKGLEIGGPGLDEAEFGLQFLRRSMHIGYIYVLHESFRVPRVSLSHYSPTHFLPPVPCVSRVRTRACKERGVPSAPGIPMVRHLTSGSFPCFLIKAGIPREVRFGDSLPYG